MSEKDINGIVKKLNQYYNSIKPIPAVKETITKVEEFLADCESANLIKFPNTQLNEYFKKADSRAIFNILSQMAHTKIIAKQNQENFVPEKEWLAFQKISNIDSMRTFAEELKVDLKAILKPEIIDPNVNELGTYLKHVYDKLGYSQEKRNEMNKIFKVDLRNALSHLDYEFTDEIFTWYDKNENPTTWTNEQLAIPIQQLSMTTHVIGEKIKEIKSQNS